MSEKTADLLLKIVVAGFITIMAAFLVWFVCDVWWGASAFCLKVIITAFCTWVLFGIICFAISN